MFAAEVLDHTHEQYNNLLKTSEVIISISVSLSKLCLTLLIWHNLDIHVENKLEIWLVY